MRRFWEAEDSRFGLLFMVEVFFVLIEKSVCCFLVGQWGIAKNKRHIIFPFAKWAAVKIS